MNKNNHQNSPTSSGSTGCNCSVILDTDDAAATYKTGLSGWVSRDGIYFGDNKDSESMARYHGCTHVACKYCGKPTPKGYTACAKCIEKKSIERFYALPEKEWDGNGCIYSDADDKYFYDLESAEEHATDDGRTIEDLRLIICEPVPYRLVEDDYWEECFPEDGGELPTEIQEAVDALNEVMEKAEPMSFAPGKFRIRTTKAYLRAQRIR